MPQTNDDAIAALRQAAEEAGLDWDFVFTAAQDFALGIVSPYLASGDVNPEYNKVTLEVAHALIAWWQRRGWVECPGTKDSACFNGYVYILTDDLPYIPCPTCKPYGGEGRVPPDG